MDKKTGLAFAAAVAGMGVPDHMNPMLGRRYATPDERRGVKNGYPLTGTGKRQGERVARQVERSGVKRHPTSPFHPFGASNRCIERIRERQQQSQT